MPLRAGRRRVIVLSALHVLLVWAVAAVVIWQNHRNAVDDWKRTAENLSLAITAYVGQALRAADLIQKSVLDWIDEGGVQTPQGFAAVMHERRYFDAMRDRMVGLPQVGVAGIISADGILISTTHEYPAPPLDMSSREVFQMPMTADAREMIVTRPTPARTSGRPMFYLARKVTSKSGELLGFVSIGLDVEYFVRFFRTVAPSNDDSWLSLFRGDGTLLATSLPRPDALGQRFENALPRRLLLAGGSGRAVFTDEPSWRDPDARHGRIIVPRQVESYPAFISLVIGDSVFLTRWRQTVYVAVGVALAMTVVTVMVASRLLYLLDKSEAASRADSERRLLSAIVDTPSALTAVLDRSGAIIRANARFREIFGSRRQLDSNDLRGGEGLFQFVAGGTAQAEVELETARAGEPPRQLHFSLSRQSLPDTGECIVMVGYDQTVRHQAQRAISQSAKLATLGEITTGIAHELSQPLNVIRVAAQNALAEMEPEEDPEDDEPMVPMTEVELRPFLLSKLRRIVAQVDRASAVIARMRIFSRSTRQGPLAFDLRDACRSALSLVHQQFKRARIEVREQLGEEPLIMVGNQPALEQVIVSLLVNARDALSECHQADKAVEIRAARGADGRLGVFVSDNGPGVPRAIRDRIFEPFFTTKPMGEGTGLGLATSYGIVRDAGGTISLSGDGPGATFVIDLPAGRQPEAAATSIPN